MKKKILATIVFAAAVMSSPLAMAGNTSSDHLSPGDGAAFNSDSNDQGHWRVNSDTGEKTWVSGEDDQAMINSALCSSFLMRQINHCE